MPIMAVHVAIDGSNVCSVGGIPPRFELKRLEHLMSQVMMMAKGINVRVRVFVDASLRHRLAKPELERLEQMIARGEVEEAPAGQAADSFLLEWADRHGAIVISNDRFREYRKRYPWLQSLDPTRRVSGTYDPGTKLWTLFGPAR